MTALPIIGSIASIDLVSPKAIAPKKLFLQHFQC
jgi:hypothetical protein